MSETVIVVPCHNEEDRLLVDEFAGFVKRRRARLLFVDDGSSDRTAEILRRMEQSDPAAIGVLSLPRNRGKGEAVRLGLLHALDNGAEVVGYFDADLATPIEELERLLDERERLDADAVLAARVGLLGWNIRRRPWRHYSGRIFATLASLALELRVYDTQCGAKVFRRTEPLREALVEPFRSRWVFDVELLARLVAGHERSRRPMTFFEVPLREWSDVGGSKLRVRSAAQAVADLVRIRRQLDRRQLDRRHHPG